MTLSRQRVVGDILFVVLLLIPGATALWAIHEQGIAHERVEHTKEVLADVATLENTTSEAESAQRAYLLTGSPECLRRYQDARPRIDRKLVDLAILTEDEPPQQQRVEQLGVAIHDRFAEMDEDIHTRRTAGLEAAATRVRLRAGASAMSAARPLIAVLIASENHDLARQHRAVEQLVAATKTSLIGSVILLLVLTSVRSYISRHHTVMPLEALARAAEAYGAGDLSVRLPTPKLDELRRLVSAFNTMAWQRQRAESDLRQATTFLQTLVACSPIPIISVDPQGRVRTWSAAAEQQSGWRASEMLGQPLPEAPAVARADTERLVTRVLGGESVAGLETETKRRDGTVIDVAIYASPLVSQGVTLGAIALVVDMTHRKAAERERASWRRSDICRPPWVCSRRPSSRWPSNPQATTTGSAASSKPSPTMPAL
jgi:PAS domain S-box-containing protein